jgi:hypothetical protein
LFVVAVVLVANFGLLPSAVYAEPSITLATDDQGRRVFDLDGIDGKQLATEGAKAGDSLSVYAIFESQLKDPPTLAGAYAMLPDGVRFTPRFPLQPGMRYRAVYRDGDATLSHEFAIPARKQGAATRLRAIYPNAKVLPQNQLKVYLQFSAPMSRGDAYRHLSLLDVDGEEVDLPFLELSEELWNPAGDRLTLLLDPARVKRELKPREELGPVLEIGRRYTLLVRRSFQDAGGQPLADEFRKDFLVAEPDETCPQPQTWRLTVPQVATDVPIVVQFGEALDHALLERMLWVVDGNGQRLPGRGAIGDDEMSWTFRPDDPWQPGHYQLVADTWLEDLAGNSIARKFELRRTTEPVTDKDTIAVEFDIDP